MEVFETRVLMESQIIYGVVKLVIYRSTFAELEFQGKSVLDISLQEGNTVSNVSQIRLSMEFH